MTYLDQDGLQLSGSQGVSLSSTVFDSLEFASNDIAQITARELNSTTNLNNVTFNLSLSSSGMSSVSNVKVSGTDGNLNWHFLGSLGNIWGEDYDTDPNNKILWDDAGERYWVAAATGNWSDTSNWSFASGSSGGASVPGAANNVFFDGGGGKNGKCLIDQTVTVANLTISGSTGIIHTQRLSVTISS